jgi:histidine triad (HIT) family protein
MEENCIFCKIAAKVIPSTIVYEDQDCLGFEDINPSAPTHWLFIPKKHIVSIAEIFLPEQINMCGLVMAAAVKTASEKGLDKTGYRIIINHGPDSGQEVFHLHIHLLAGKKLGPLLT